MSHERRALAKNTILQVGGKLIGTAVGLATFYVLVHGLGTDGYGALTTALTYASLFAIVVDFGLTLTTAQLISEKGADEERILGNLFSLRLVTGFFFMSLAPITSFFLPATPAIRIAILLCSLSFFLSTTAQVFIGVFQKRLLLSRAVVAETASRVVSFVLICLAMWLHLGIVAAAAAFAAGSVVQIILMLGATLRHVTIWPRWESSVLLGIIARSWPIGVSILFNLIYLKGDILFMWLLGRTETEIGLYGSAYKVVDVITTVPVMFMGLMLPILAVHWSAKRADAFRTKLQESFDTMAILAIPFAIGSVLVGEPLMALIKPDLVTAGTVLHILGPTSAVVFFGSLFGHAVVAVNKQRPMTWAYVFVAVVAVIGYVTFIPTSGIFAAAWVSFVSEMLIAVIAAIVVCRTAKFVPGIALALRSIFAAIAMGGVIVLLSTHVLLEVLIGCMVYSVVLGLLGGPSPRKIIGLFMPERQPITTP
ncbi:MAG: oligosaccharide flippase family protein [Candidatus Uhrbacteria bacterium]|nr:oligosaccharide flippase family protein [Candidatus Uhrbacteria bacterium]